MAKFNEIYCVRHSPYFGTSWRIDVSRDLVETAWSEAFPGVALTEEDAVAWVNDHVSELADLAHRKINLGKANPPNVSLEASDWL